MATEKNTPAAPTPEELFVKDIVSIADRGEYDVQQLGKFLLASEVEAIDAHQVKIAKDGVRELAKYPVPLELLKTNREGLLMLGRNTAMYDDDVEDLIDADSINSALVELQKESPKEEQAAAIRTRRSVIAFIVSHEVEAPTQLHPEGEETETQTRYTA